MRVNNPDRSARENPGLRHSPDSMQLLGVVDYLRFGFARFKLRERHPMPSNNLIQGRERRLVARVMR